MKDAGLSDLRLHRTMIQGGAWEGVLTAVGARDELPSVTLCHRDAPVAEAVLSPKEPGVWAVRVDIPAAALSDGVQTFTLVETATGLKLDSFAVALGEALGDDIRAEVDLLRAELDLLKRAFRRHCAETGTP